MANYDNMWCLGEVCQYDTDTGDEVGFNSNREEHAIPTVTARRKELETVKEDIHPELCQNDTDTGDDYNARTLWEASLDTGECQPGQFTCLGQTPSLENQENWCDLCLGHFLGCWYEREPCQGEVCRDEAADEVCQDMGKSSNERVAGKETADEATDGRTRW